MIPKRKSVFRALFISDIHMSNSLPYASPIGDGLTDRFQDQLRLWKHVHAVAHDYEVEAIFNLGDVFDKAKVDPVTLTHTVKAIMASEVPHYILPGNHDSDRIQGGRFSVEAFDHMRSEKVRVIGGDMFKCRHVKFWPIQFMPAEDAMRKLERFRKLRDQFDNGAGVDVLLLHHSIVGASHLGWVCDDGLDGDEICKGFDHAISGHFHDHQEFGDCGFYLGAPMHHHFGDVGRRAGFWVIDFDERGDMERTFIESKTPTFHKFTDLDDKAELRKGDYVRYEIEATHADWVPLRMKAESVCAYLRVDGIRADFKHKPIYHHESRLMSSDTGDDAKMSMKEAVASYVEDADVVVGGLDPDVLKRIGREILAESEDEHEFV